MGGAPTLVVFDLYGTLIRFGSKLHPFRKIFLWAREHSRKPAPDDARKLMTLNMDPERLLATMGIYPPGEMLEQLHLDIEQELNSLTLFEDTIPVIESLSKSGVAIAICSNLAQPYGKAIDKLLPRSDIIMCLSYQVGFIKPEKGIYEWLTYTSGISPEQTLFIGDTYLADYKGPKQFGFEALHLSRGQPPARERISGLKEILGFWS